ncbi:MAG TPA: VanZ family protein [Thermoanaerobaculia bacterium]|nr:VanZ family protein [Thermoanaerobaculia bacterium]
MGRSELRVIRVRKRVSVLLLVLVSAAIAALLWWLSGRAYSRVGTAELVARLADAPSAVTNDRVIASLMPVVANVLLFVPWGFLLFVVLDGPSRPRRRSYALTFACGLLFALGLAAWQLLLPTRVTTFADAFPNGLGALAGAACGHLRKQVHLRFEW